MQVFDYIFLVIFPICSTVCVLPSYLPQIRKTSKTKNVEGISLGFWWFIVGYIFFTWATVIYMAIKTGIFGSSFPLTVNLVSAIIMFILVYRYRKKPKTKTIK